MTYIAVTRTLQGISAGVITMTDYVSEERFKKRLASVMGDGSGRRLSDVYEVLAHGVTDEEAKRLCESPVATLASMESLKRQIGVNISAAEYAAELMLQRNEPG